MNRILTSFAVSLSLILSGCGPIGFNNDSSHQSSSSALDDCQKNCNSGCCTKEGQCLPGTSTDACGAAGYLCNACPSPQPCNVTAGGGTCGGCSAFNCNGCCTADGQCHAGVDNALCGNDGRTCTDCGSGYCQSTGVGGGTCQ